MDEFAPPGPGFWRKDDSHLPDPASHYCLEFYRTRLSRYLGPAMEFYGSPIERGDFEVVAGRIYSRVKPVGAPEPKEGKTPGKPPKLIFKLVSGLSPTVRRRTKRAAEVIDKKVWREVLAKFNDEIAPKATETNRRLQAIDPRALDDKELHDHLAELEKVLDEGFERHHYHGPAIRLPVGDWLHHTVEWTGESAVSCLRALRGSSPASSASGPYIDKIAAAVAKHPAALAAMNGAGEPVERLARMRAASSEVAEAIDAYLDRYGNVIATGYDFEDLTLSEMPHVLLATVSARMKSRHSSNGVEETQKVLAELREKVPEEHRAEYDGLVEDALMMFGLRDADVAVLWSWPMGLLRRALLAAGERLVQRGKIADRELIFEGSPDEVRALVQGADAPTSDALAARRAERVRLLKEVGPSPIQLGVKAEPPPDDWLAPQWARMMHAILEFHHMTDIDGAPRTKSSGAVLGGHGVSRGRYEGPARIVLGPQDFHRVAQGDVLVTRITSAGFNVILPMLGAVVCDRGGPLCHAAVVAREFGMPGVVGTGNATTRITDGCRVLVDGEAGTVEILG